MSRARIVVNTHGLESIADDFLAAPEQIDAAGKRALRKTVNWLTAHTRKGIAAELGADHRKLRTRVTGRTFVHAGEVNIGLDRLPAHLVGEIGYYNTKGVNVGERYFPGAFAAQIYTAEEKVWIRLHSKRYDAELYPYKARKFAGSTPAELRHRFPVVLATVPMDTPGVRRVIDEHATLAGDRLRTVYARELNYATNVEGA